MWCKSLTLEKFISFRIKWLFSPSFLSVSPYLLLNLARRQCYAYAIGLYTRLEIKSWPDVKFCAHAPCVLPRCWSGASPGIIGSVIPGLYHELWRHREILAENDTISTKSSSAHVEERDENDRVKRQGWITYYACPWHHLFTCLSLCAKHSCRVKILHVRPFYLLLFVKLIFVNANQGEILQIR